MPLKKRLEARYKKFRNYGQFKEESQVKEAN